MEDKTEVDGTDHQPREIETNPRDRAYSDSRIHGDGTRTKNKDKAEPATKLSNLTSSVAYTGVKSDKSKDCLCGTCNKQVNDGDKALECEVCLQWFHTKCQKVSTKLYNALSDEGDSCAWYCTACKCGAKQLRLQIISLQRDQMAIESNLKKVTEITQNNLTEIISLKSNIRDMDTKYERSYNGLLDRVNDLIPSANVTDEVKKRLEDMEESFDARLNKLEGLIEGNSSVKDTTMNYAGATAEVAALEIKIDKLSNTLKTYQNNGATNDTRALRQGLSELEDIEKRKLNLVVFNLPEAGNPDGDIEKFKTMIKDEFKLSVKVKEATRLGRRNEDKPRMLRIRLEALSEKKLILSKAKDLRVSTDTIYSTVYIRPDLTKKQLEESKNLREQLKDKRSKDSTKKWTIRRGEIVELEMVR